MGKDEVEGTETHDGHDVGGVGEKWVMGDGEDGGDGVESEYDVGEFDGDKREQQHGDHALAVFDDEEVIGSKADRMDPGEPAEPEWSGFARVCLWIFWKEQTDGRDEEDGGEEIGDPVEVG